MSEVTSFPVDRLGRTPTERFWTKFERDEFGCWLWHAAADHLGYGRIGLAGKVVLAHRFAYELLVGPIPAGLDLDHLCRVPACVNPAHLEPVTHRENQRRGMARHFLGLEQSRKTHCPQGHPYDEANTYRHNGRRYCRTCKVTKTREARRAG